MLGSNTAAHILNFVVLTAALSVYNSGVYCNSRMLFGMAEQGDAPKALMKINKQGVPVRALGISALVTLLCVVINYVAPKDALVLLFALVVASLMINWALISLTHIKFRKAMGEQGVVPSFKTFWFPFSNYLCLAFMLVIVGVMLAIPDMRPSVYAIPVWLAFMWVCYVLKNKRKAQADVSAVSSLNP
jgi:aromatic amino acid transport protein AroP